ncbi:MAG: type I glyceraldehyde-3-phosphate dehydrogenase [Candidatus Diapherotrites archaeon]|nr:type I glyceraldehyde-3-phosphate dehydrogenase [Candidatus Diapherotrites archaeon]
MFLVRIAINGFGRIGRVVARALHERHEKNVEIVAINDLAPPNTLEYLLKYDSVYGRFPGEVKLSGNSLHVNGKEIAVLSEKNPEALPWGKLGVDIVLESTGVFRSIEDSQKHLTAGAKRVILSAPPKDNMKQIVLGVNQDQFDHGNDKIISMASCTTNCLAPIAKVLNDSFGIEKGFMTTVHAYTNDQHLLDLPHKDLRRSRAAPINIVPTTTGAAKALGAVIPALQGKMDGFALRVPVPVGSVTDLVVYLNRDASPGEINAEMKKAAEGKMKGILEYTEDEIVSSDIIGNAHSSIFDSKQTITHGKLAKVLSWYDNEYGFSNRLIDLFKFVEK